MADIRETVLLDHMDTARFRRNPGTRAATALKLATRRFVVATAGTPLRHLYHAIYRAHVSYAVKRLRKLPGIHSIYITGGMAIDELIPGISDIDLTVNGVWSESEQADVIEVLKQLGQRSPLYDTLLSQCTQSLDTLKSLYETDYFFQYLFNRGRTRWKRLYGEDIFALLPPVPEARLGGGYYMELRTWWCYFVKSAFGFGPTATDELFRMSIPYKTVAGVLGCETFFGGGTPANSRRSIMRSAAEACKGQECRLHERLAASASSRHRKFDGDIQEETFRFLMPRLETIHARLGENPTFESAGVHGIHIDASSAEMMVSAPARAYVHQVVERVKHEWAGYRSAYLVPSLSFFYPDDLVLLLEVRPSELPSVKQIRDICRFALDNAGELTQRVALFLLLPEAAYQLEIVSVIELWHHTLCPQANPEAFALLERAEFVVDGEPRAASKPPFWSRFANDLVTEEIAIRRAAFSKAAQAGDVPSLELLRNLWRQLQLEIVTRSVQHGFAVLPLTPASVQRMMQQFGIPDAPVLGRMREAYQSEIDGHPVDIRPLLPELMALFAVFSEEEAAMARG